ncbi:MAG: hypothetical protein ACRDGL_05710 [Candidatus Limnocylindrales bacterium]
MLVAVTTALLASTLLAGAASADVGSTHRLDLYDPAGVRFQQPDAHACVAAAGLMMLDMAATANDPGLAGSTWTPTVLYSVQEAMLAWARGHDTLSSSGSGTDPHGWRNLMNYYGWGSIEAGVYADRSFTSFDAAVKATVVAVARYHLPVGLLMEAGVHADLVTGYDVTGADPATGSTAFTLNGLYLTDPWQSHAHLDTYVAAEALRSTGASDIRFVPYTQTDSPYRDPVDGQIGRAEWYGRWVIIAPTKATVPAPAPTPPKAQPAIGAVASSFAALGPTRLLDTRVGLGLSGPLLSHQARTVQVAGRAGVPTDATAVTLNATLVDQTAAGYLSLTPSTQDDPTTSTLNAPRGDIRANGATVPLGKGGKLSLTFGGPPGSTTDVALDVTGAYVPAGGSLFVPLAPTRTLDTRTNVGLSGRFTAGVPRSLKVGGVAGVPKGATAVAVNLTVTGQTRAGYLSLTTAAPSGGSSPQTSTLNFPGGEVRANNAIVAVAKDGTIAITYEAAAGASTDVVLDVTGAYAGGPGLTFMPLTPTRFVDTRANLGLSYDFVSGRPRSMDVAGLAGIPKTATAAVVNLTTAGATNAGYLSLTSAPIAAPKTSTLNFRAADVRANGAVVPLAAGALSITYTATVDSHDSVVLDVVGYFAP